MTTITAQEWRRAKRNGYATTKVSYRADGTRDVRRYVVRWVDGAGTCLVPVDVVS